MAHIIKRGEKLPRAVFIRIGVDNKEEVNDGNDENAGEFSTDGGDKYFSHSMYRDIIAKGFDKRFPSKLTSNKPAYFPIDDPVTRTLAASKY